MHALLLEQIKKSLRLVIDQTQNPMAAFDADGTLWPSDIGKDFFKYQVQQKLLNHSDPQQEFNNIKDKTSKKKALEWLALGQAGCRLTDIRQQVADFLKKHPINPFSFQQHLIEWLIKYKVSVFVVSSSLKWVLDEAIPMGYSIKCQNIIGVETKTVHGKITNQLVQPTPIQEDKPLAFHRCAGDSPPIFSSGNTLSDQALLERASHIRLVIASAVHGRRNYDSEQALLTIAKQKKWFYLEQPISASNSSTSLGAS